jgi:peptidoglycan/LPS O-acetylase OafA/YrhL
MKKPGVKESRPKVSAHFRLDIQGLRAVAVLMVFGYHIAPRWFPGGFVGVDVFFVLSGFLIGGLLIREVSASRKLAVGKFFVRRLRRLAPAALLVLFVCSVAVFFLPRWRWRESAIEIFSSALYVENWALYFFSVDYLASDRMPSLVQHFWTLSVEEQLYLSTALIFLLLIGFRDRIGRDFWRVLFAVFAVMTVASFLLSIATTSADPSLAYFSTLTRFWEFGFGVLVALAQKIFGTEIPGNYARVIGLVMIIFSTFLISGDSFFPGFIALLPTIGTVLILLSSADKPNSLTSFLQWRPVQFLGKVSYSIYLWHWPLIVFATSYGVAMDSPLIIVLLGGATLILSHVTTEYVEAPFRRRENPVQLALPLGGSLGAIFLVAGGLFLSTFDSKEVDLDREKYPGPDTLLFDTNPPLVSHLVPRNPREDKALAYSIGCHTGARTVELNPCKLGDRSSDIRIFLIGDSHAANWIPAFEVVADKRGLSLDTHTKSACPPLTEAISRNGERYDTCFTWGENVLQEIERTSPDFVVFTMSAGRLLYSGGEMNQVLLDTWDRILTSGSRLIVIADTPKHGFNPLECNLLVGPCFTPRDEAFRPDSMREASVKEPRAQWLDMNDTLCTSDQCPIVIGNVIAWRDDHHLTATYSRMLGPILDTRLQLDTLR